MDIYKALVVLPRGKLLLNYTTTIILSVEVWRFSWCLMVVDQVLMENCECLGWSLEKSFHHQ